MTTSAPTSRTATLIARAERYAERAATAEYLAWVASHVEMTSAYATTAPRAR